MSFRGSSAGSTDIAGAIDVDESEEYNNEEDDVADDSDTPQRKTPSKARLPSRPASSTSSSSFRLPTTGHTTASQPSASASFSFRNRPGGTTSPLSPTSPSNGTLSRFASFFRPGSSHSLTSPTQVSVPTTAPDLFDGMEVIKLDRHGAMSRKRLYLQFDDERQGGRVSWDSDRLKKEKAVMLLGECRLECGSNQGWFINIKGKERSRLVSSHCFSLLGEKRSLDIICKTEADANVWIAAISPYLAPLTALPPCTGRLMRMCVSNIKSGALNLPQSISVSPATGQLFVANTGGDNLLVFDRQGVCLAVWGRKGSGDTGFSAPTGVGMAWDEALCYVCDAGNARVQVLDVGGALRESWADQDHHSQPVAVAVSPHTHRLYIADQAMRCVQVYTSAGEHVSLIQVAERDCIRIGGVAVSGTGDSGEGVDERLWVSNCQHHRVECYDVASGMFVRSIGSKGPKLGHLFTPRGLAFDAVHRLLYVCDADNHRMVVWSVEREEWTVEWGREGQETAEFSKPHGVAVCPLTGLVYVADTRNNRVQVFY